MKRFYKSTISIIFCWLVFAACINTVIADGTVADLCYLDSPTSIIVSIEWEKNDVDFTIISPRGREISKDSREGDIAMVSFEKTILVLIKNAEAGQWKLRYDKGSNDHISVSVDEYEEGIWITEFEIEEPENDRIPVKFMVEYDKTVKYNYTLSLSLDEGGVEREIASGIATTNKQESINAYLGIINSYDKYLLKLQVTYSKDGYEYFDIAYSRPFCYTNVSAPNPIENYDICIDPDNTTITIDWSKYIPYYSDEVLIAIFQNDDTTPVLFERFENNETSVSTFYNPENEKIVIDIKLKNKHIYSASNIKTIYPKKRFDDFYIELEGAEVINSNRYKLLHYNADKQLIRINVNGQEDTVVLNGTGEKFINLYDDNNDVDIEYTDKDSVKWVYHKSIYVDRIPPVLQIFENIDGIRTSDDVFVIVGSTDPDAMLKINGEEINKAVNGRFSYEMQLPGYENKVLITSTDTAGNAASYNAVIYRKQDGKDIPPNDFWTIYH